MDKYLTSFSEQLDATFKAETLFPAKETGSMGWLKRKFIIRKKGKKQLKRTLTVMDTAGVEYIQLTA